MLEKVVQKEKGMYIMKCTSCGLVQRVPFPTPAEVKKLYAHDWEHFTPYRSQTRSHRVYFETLLSFLLRVLPNKNTLRILDVGSATGIFLSVCKNRKVSAVGVDVSNDAVLYCRKKGFRVYHGTLTHVVNQKQWRSAFDVVVACQVIEHEPDPLRFFQTVRRVLKPGGLCVVTTPDHDTWWRSIMRSRWIGYYHPEHLFFFTPDTLSRIMQKAGLSVSMVQRDFSRGYTLSYALQRLDDYMPLHTHPFQYLANRTKGLPVSLSCNPWGDIIVVCRPIL